jgi:glutaconyl-CoA/methylmalonyl-CoA decarboxylase subunit gamma
MKYQVEIDGQTYQVEIEDLQARPVMALVDGERFEVWPESEPEAPQAVEAAPEISIPAGQPVSPEPSPAGAGGKDLTAPLPGVIVAIMVQPGDQVSRGQELVTLEAMKMKNALKSHRDGTIASVSVSVGDQVAHGQTLVVFKD